MGGEGRTLSTFQGQAAKDVSDLGKGVPDGVVRRRPRSPPRFGRLSLLGEQRGFRTKEILLPVYTGRDRSGGGRCTSDAGEEALEKAGGTWGRAKWSPGREWGWESSQGVHTPVSIICFPDWALSWGLSLFVHARPTRVSHQLPGPQAPAPRSLWGALPTSLAHLSLHLSRHISHWPACILYWRTAVQTAFLGHLLVPDWTLPLGRRAFVPSSRPREPGWPRHWVPEPPLGDWPWGLGSWGQPASPGCCVLGWGRTQDPITGHLFAEGGLACRPVSWERVKSQVSQEQESVTSRVKGRQESELMVDLSSPPPPRPQASPTSRKYDPARERSRVLISSWKSG